MALQLLARHSPVLRTVGTGAAALERMPRAARVVVRDLRRRRKVRQIDTGVRLFFDFAGRLEGIGRGLPPHHRSDLRPVQLY